MKTPEQIRAWLKAREWWPQFVKNTVAFDYRTAEVLSGDRGEDTIIDAFADNNLLLQEFRVRKLTPRECFRLMGVSDADIDRIQASGVSRSQQYRMAGNSIVVFVLFHIFRKMFAEPSNDNGELELF